MQWALSPCPPLPAHPTAGKTQVPTPLLIASCRGMHMKAGKLAQGRPRHLLAPLHHSSLDSVESGWLKHFAGAQMLSPLAGPYL